MDGIPSDPMALVISKFKRASSTFASDIHVLNTDNMLGSSQWLGGSGWFDGVVNTEKKYLLKREALAKPESAVVEL